MYNPSKKHRRLIAVDETVVKVNGYRCYLWAAIDVDSREVLAVYISRGRSMLNALIFLKRVLKACENNPVIVVDRGPWYPWTLKRLEIEYFHETFGERNRIERWFRKTKRKNKEIQQQHKHKITKESRRDSESNSTTTQHNHTEQRPRRGNTNLTVSDTNKNQIIKGIFRHAPLLRPHNPTLPLNQLPNTLTFIILSLSKRAMTYNSLTNHTSKKNTTKNKS